MAFKIIIFSVLSHLTLSKECEIDIIIPTSYDGAIQMQEDEIIRLNALS